MSDERVTVADKRTAVDKFWKTLNRIPAMRRASSYEDALSLALEYLTGDQIEAITEDVSE